MHPSLATIPTPPHLAPWVPPVRNRSVGVRFELGQIAPEPVPPRPYRDGTVFVNLAPRLDPLPCADCGTTFTPRATNHVRCSACGGTKRRRDRSARWIQDRDAQHAAKRRQAA